MQSDELAADRGNLLIAIESAHWLDHQRKTDQMLQLMYRHKGLIYCSLRGGGIKLPSCCALGSVRQDVRLVFALDFEAD